mgnify:CR=1 FL=1
MLNRITGQILMNKKIPVSAGLPLFLFTGAFLALQLAMLGYWVFFPRILGYADPAAAGLLTFTVIFLWLILSTKSLAGIGGHFRQVQAHQTPRQ